jgi:hypothetical protein
VRTRTFSGKVADVNRLIAIMLGRLKMDVDKCISAYSELMNGVFDEKLRPVPIDWTGRIKAQFDSKRLKNAIEEVVIRYIGASKEDRFNDGTSHGCRV